MSNFDSLSDIEKEHGIGGGNVFRPNKLEVGNHVIKLLSDFQVLVEYWDPEKKRTYTIVGAEKNPAEKAIPDDAKRVSYLLYVLDKSDDTIKLAQLGHSIIKGISTLKKTTGYEFDELPIYDIIIKKEKTGPEARDVKYSVIPGKGETKLTTKQEEELKTLETPADIIEKKKQGRLDEVGGDNSEAVDI